MTVTIQEKTKTDFDDDFDDLEAEYYPDWFIRELNRIGDEAVEQYKRGELKPISSVEEYALKFGVKL